MEGGHRGATGGRHWARGLHSCRLLLLIGTVVTTRAKRQRVKDASSAGRVWGLIPSGDNGGSVYVLCYILCRKKSYTTDPAQIWKIFQMKIKKYLKMKEK